MVVLAEELSTEEANPYTDIYLFWWKQLLYDLLW